MLWTKTHFRKSKCPIVTVFLLWTPMGRYRCGIPGTPKCELSLMSPQTVNHSRQAANRSMRLPEGRSSAIMM